MIGQTISHYLIIEKLGGGGMGVVYKGEDTKLHRHVALKFLSQGVAPGSTALRRFEREAQAASALNHPNICTIYEVEEHNHQPVIVMELLEGESLKERIEKGPISTEELLAFGLQSSAALEAAHAKGIIHRDIKPGNIFIVGEGRVKILDFGLAKVICGHIPENEPDEESLTVEGIIPGTTAYMFPEQINGEELDARTDLFSLGVVVYELATGRRPFKGKNRILTLDAILHTRPTPPSTLNPALPVALEQIINKCLEKDRNLRYQRAAEMEADLKRVKRAAENGQSAHLLTAPATPTRSIRFLWVAAVVGVLGAASLLAWRFARSSKLGTSPIHSMAVLPFGQSSDNSGVDYLREGLPEEITNSLSRLPGLRVMARSTLYRYKSGDDPQTAGHTLHVDAMLAGRVTHHGTELDLETELVDVATGAQLWGNRYTRDINDASQLQTAITRDLIAYLRPQTSPQARAALARASTKDAQAYQLYLKGRYYWSKGTLEGLQKGVEYFKQAIEKDPGNAQAYAGLADCYDDLGGGMAYLPPQENFPKAKAAATKALEIDESLAEAHTALGWAEWGYDWDWSTAEREFKRAIELDPSSAVAHGRYASYLVAIGRFDEAIAEGRQAQDIDPLSPRVAGFLGYDYLAAGRYDEAISQLKKAIELDPTATWLHGELAWAYTRKGMYAQAIAEHEGMGAHAYAVTKENQVVASGLAWVYALAGKREDALRILEAFNRLSSQAYVDSYQVGVIYAGLEDNQRVFQSLEKAYEQRSGSMAYIKADPFWSNVRSDPRYADLVRRMGLPQVPLRTSP
jgi:serine/threonine protein kinase/Tfp pilus assembly protein PilF